MGETDRNSEGHITASDFHGIDADIPFTALDDCTASDDFNGLINSDTDHGYDSELEVSETQFETLETGEMNQDEESVSALADRALPSASRVALRGATQITGDKGVRGLKPPSMKFE